MGLPWVLFGCVAHSATPETTAAAVKRRAKSMEVVTDKHPLAAAEMAPAADMAPALALVASAAPREMAAGDLSMDFTTTAVAAYPNASTLSRTVDCRQESFRENCDWPRASCSGSRVVWCSAAASAAGRADVSLKKESVWG